MQGGTSSKKQQPSGTDTKDSQEDTACPQTLRELTLNLMILSIIELKATNFLAQKTSLQGLGGRTKSKMGPTDETKYCHQAWGLSLAVPSLSTAL